MVSTVRFGTLVGLISFVAVPPVMAQSLASLEERLHDHPSLEVFGLRAEASRERATAAFALPDPEIALGINNFPIEDPGFDRYLPTNKAIGIRQVFPSRAGREARSAGAESNAVYLESMRAARFSQLRAELISLLHERKRIERQQVLTRQREGLYQELLKTIAAQVDAGQPVVYRLAQIALESAEEERVLADLMAEAERVNARLIDLLGEVPRTDAPPVDVQEWSGEPGAFHAVRLAQDSVQIASAGVDQAEAAWKPTWGAELVYKQRDEGSGEPGATFDGDDWVSGRVTFTVPLWASGSQDPMLRAAQADEAAAQAEVMAAARAARAGYRSLEARRTASVHNEAILAEKIRIFEDQLESLMTLYESGSGSYAETLDAEIAIVTLRAEVAAEQSRIAATTALMNAFLVTP